MRRQVEDSHASLKFDGSSTRVRNSDGVVDFEVASTVLVEFLTGVRSSRQQLLSYHEASGTPRAGVTLNADNTVSTGYYNGSSYVNTYKSQWNPDKWNTLVYTLDSEVSKVFIDGDVGVDLGTSSPTTSNPGGVTVGDQGGAYFQGNMKRVMIWNRVLTDSEIAIVSAGGDIGAEGLHLSWNFDEGAGEVAYDLSGNSRNGTIRDPLWRPDTPTAARKPVNPNLVKNGDFSYIPRVNVAQTGTTGQWIDGTSDGGGDNMFGYSFFTGSASSVKFDDSELLRGMNSFKISSVSGSGPNIFTVLSTATAEIEQNAFVLEPSTEYTVSYWMKTVVNSGASDDGAFLAVAERNSSGGQVIDREGTYVNSDTDWTQYEVTFTTGGATRYGFLKLKLNQSGAQSLAMDTWFADIQLRKTADIARPT